MSMLWFVGVAHASATLLGPPVKVPAVVVGIGDVDHDGYDELAIGDEVWFGAPLLLDPATVRRQTGLPSLLARSATADFDGDTYGDVMAYVPAIDGVGGALTVYYGSATGVDLTRATAWPATGAADHLGQARCAADLDGDGLADLAFGRYVDGIYAIEVHFGAAAGLSPTADRLLEVKDVPDGDGALLLCPGDPTGDGVADLVFVDATSPADVLVYPGGPGGPIDAPLVFDPGAKWALSGAADVGDVDGDGYDDLAVQAEGVQYVLFGDPAGFSRTQAYVDDTGAHDQTIGGGTDLTGDQISDLLIGGPGVPKGPDSGWFELYRGAPGGPLTIPEPYIGLGWSFGMYPTPIGDTNGDGLEELAVRDNFDGVWIFYPNVDVDGDYLPSIYDCDDHDPLRFGPDALWPDADHDGWGIELLGESILACSADGYAAEVGDCHDGDAAVHPEAIELPSDDVDQDCDGLELCYFDYDGDGARTEGTAAVPNLGCDGTDQITGDAPVDCDDDDPNRAVDCADPGDTDSTIDEVHEGASGAPSEKDEGGCDTGGAGPGWLALALLPLLRRRR